MKHQPTELIAAAMAHTTTRDFDDKWQQKAAHMIWDLCDQLQSTQEIRLDERGGIDEIVVSNVHHFHLERMDDNCFWIGLGRGDLLAERVDLHIDILAGKRGKLRVTVRDEGMNCVTVPYKNPWPEGGVLAATSEEVQA